MSNSGNNVAGFKQETHTSTLSVVAERFSKEYGTEVVENRAVPEFRDGCKPVHRAALWAMYKLGLTYKSNQTKAARVVGDVIGKYHPHGDQSTYDAIVTIANTLPNLVEGYGNWGSHVSGAAAYRYTECRLSEFSTRFLLDPKYISVTPMIKNFSGEEEWPLFLPAKLPVQLMIGSPTIPAYGISAGTPPFCIEGVWKVTKLALAGKTITPKLAAKYMKVRYPYGGDCITDTAEYEAFFQTGKGTLTFIPDIQIDWQKKEINIESCAPGFMSFNSTSSKIETIGNLDGVRRVEDESGINAGEYGIRYVVETKRGMSEEQFDVLVDKVQKILVGKQAYHIGYTRRKKDETSFGRASVTQFFDMWVRYRVSLEKAVVRNLIKEEQEKAAKNELMVLAVELRDLIFKSLEAKDPYAYLASKLTIGRKYKFLTKYYENKSAIAKALLGLQVIKLAKLNTAPYEKELRNNVNTIRELTSDLENPNERILREMGPEVEKYLKTTKDNIYLIRKGDS